MNVLKRSSISSANSRESHRAFFGPLLFALTIIFVSFFFFAAESHAATLPTLSPVSPDSSFTAGQYSSGSTAWNLIDDDPDSPVTSDWVANDTNETTAVLDLNLTNMPADFLTMDTLDVDIYINAPVGYGNDTTAITARVYQSNGSTALTNETGTLASEGSSAGKYNASFAGLNTSANKTTWDGALLRITWTYVKNTGPDNAYIPVAAVELDGTYSANTITLTGTAYSDEGSTALGSGKTIKARIGTSTASIHSTTTDASGNWSIPDISGANISSGDAIHVWIDGATEKAVHVTKINTVTNLSGLDLYQNRVIVGSETANITNTDLGEYDGDDDADIKFTSNAGAMVVNAGNELYVWSGDTYAPGGAVTVRGNASTGVDGSFHLPASATYTAGGNTTIAGNLAASSSATWTPGVHTITFNATTTGKTIDTSFANLGTTTFDGVGGAWSFAQANATTSTLIITNGTLTAPSNRLVIQGNYTNNGSFTHNSGTVQIKGGIEAYSASGTLTGSSALNNLEIDVANFTFSNNASTTDFTSLDAGNINAPAVLSIAGDYSNPSGNFEHNSGTVNFNGGSAQTLSGQMTGTADDFNNVIFSGAGTKTFSNNASTTGDFTIQSGSGDINTPASLSISGDFTNNSTDFSMGTSEKIHFNGSSQTIAGTLNTVAAKFGDVIFSGSGIKTLSNNASTTDFKIESGATVSAPTGLSICGDYTQNGSFTDNSGTVFLCAALSQTLSGTMNTATTDFYNIVKKQFGSASFPSNASTTNLTIDSGGTIVAPSGVFSISGDYTCEVGCIMDHNSGTVVFDGTTAQDLSGDMIGTSQDFNNVIFRGTGTKTFSNNASTTDFTINSGSGAVTAPTVLSIAGNYTNNSTFTHGSGLIHFTGSSKTLSGTLTGSSAFNDISVSGSLNVSNNASTTDLAIESGGTFTSPTSLSISGDYSNSGSFVQFGGAITTHFNGASPQTISGQMTGTDDDFNNVIFSGAGTKTFLNDADLGGNLTIDATSGAVTAPTNLTITGNFTNNSSFLDNGGTVVFNGGGIQTISGTFNTATTDFNNISFSGVGTKIFGTNASTTNLTYISGVLVALPSYLSIRGDYVNSGGAALSWSVGDKILFDGTSAQDFSGTMTGASQLPEVIFRNAGTKTFSNNASTTNFTIQSGSGAVTAPSGILSISGDYTNNSEFTDNGGTVFFNGGSAQTIAGQMTGTADDFSNITFSGAGTKTFSNNASTTGNFTIQSGSGSVIAPTLLTIDGDYIQNGSFTSNSGLVHLSGSSAQDLSGNMTSYAFFDLSFSGAGTKTFSNDVTVTGDLNIQSGSAVVAPALIMTVYGDYTNSGSFDANGGIVDFSGTSPQIISGTMNTTATDFNDIRFYNSGTKTFTNNASTTDFTINSGSGAVTAPTVLSISGNYINNSVFTDNGGTVYLNGTAAQTLSGQMTGTADDFYNITILNTSGAGDSSQSVSFAAAASTSNRFTMVASTSAEFASGETYTVGEVHLDGDSGSFAWLRSSTPGSEYYFDISAGTTTLVNYANIEDNNICPDLVDAEDGTNVDAGNNSCWSFVAGATADLSSAANQSFVLGQATTTISTITVTDSVFPSVTAANDIHIVIATTTVDMVWDTFDTTPTFGGTASGKVDASVTYSANGDTMIVDVTSDFSTADTLTIADLSFAQFDTFSAPANVLGIRTDGTGSGTNNTDDKTVSISGGLTLDNHTAGSIPNNFNSISGSGETFFGFSLQGVGESVDITNIVFRLTEVVNVLTADLTNLLLYRDNNNDRVFDGGDTAVGGSGTPSISGSTGDITFSTTFQEDTTQSNYILIGDYAKVKPGEQMIVSLATSDISATGVTSGGSIPPDGSSDEERHRRKGASGGGGGGGVGGGSGGGSQQGGGGGGEGGGETGIDPDTGTSLGNEFGFEKPTTNSGSWTNGGNAYDSDGSYADSSSTNQTHNYGTFGFVVPGANEITGIEVKFEAHDTDTAGDIDVQLTCTTCGGYTTAQNSGTLTATDAVYTFGGPNDDWGHSWIPSDTDDGSLEVRVTSKTAATVHIDAMQVRVYHQATGGGGGGGGGEVSRPSGQHFANVFSAFYDANLFTQLLLFAGLMSFSVALSLYLRTRHEQAIAQEIQETTESY